jgi:hypothetical protein
VSEQTQSESGAAPAPGRGGDHADKLSGIQPLVHDAREPLPPQPPAARIAMRINQGDPEMVSRTTSSGIIGGGG